MAGVMPASSPPQDKALFSVGAAFSRSGARHPPTSLMLRCAAREGEASKHAATLLLATDASSSANGAPASSFEASANGLHTSG